MARRSELRQCDAGFPSVGERLGGFHHTKFQDAHGHVDTRLRGFGRAMKVSFAAFTTGFPPCSTNGDCDRAPGRRKVATEHGKPCSCTCWRRHMPCAEGGMGTGLPVERWRTRRDTATRAAALPCLCRRSTLRPRLPRCIPHSGLPFSSARKRQQRKAVARENHLTALLHPRERPAPASLTSLEWRHRAGRAQGNEHDHRRCDSLAETQPFYHGGHSLLRL